MIDRSFLEKVAELAIESETPATTVIDGVTGYVQGDEAEFAARAVALLTDDALWRRQHEAALQYQQGISWSEHAGRLEAALLSDMIPIYRSVLATPPR